MDYWSKHLRIVIKTTPARYRHFGQIPSIRQHSTAVKRSILDHSLRGSNANSQATTLKDQRISPPHKRSKENRALHTSSKMSSTDLSSPFAYPPQQTALLLMDFLALFPSLLPQETWESTLATAIKMRKWALENDILIVHCLIDVDTEPASTCLGKDRLKGMLEMLRADGGKGAAEIAGLATPSASTGTAVGVKAAGGVRQAEVTVKRQPGLLSVLKSEGLTELLEDRGIKSLVLCGVSTSACVLRTVCAAADEGFVVTVVKDGVADPEVEVGEMVLERLIARQAHVLGSENLLQEFSVRS